MEMNVFAMNTLILDLMGVRFSSFTFSEFHNLIHQSLWSFSCGPISVETFGFICSLVFQQSGEGCTHHTELLLLLFFDYTRVLGQTRAQNMASSRSAVFSMTAAELRESGIG